MPKLALTLVRDPLTHRLPLASAPLNGPGHYMLEMLENTDKVKPECKGKEYDYANFFRNFDVQENQKEEKKTMSDPLTRVLQEHGVLGENGSKREETLEEEQILTHEELRRRKLENILRHGSSHHKSRHHKSHHKSHRHNKSHHHHSSSKSKSKHHHHSSSKSKSKHHHHHSPEKKIPKLGEIMSQPVNGKVNITYSHDQDKNRVSDYLTKFYNLRKRYPRIAIPDTYNDCTPPDVLQREYDTWSRRCYTDDTVENYKSYLRFGFSAIETILVQFLKLNAKGLADYESQNDQFNPLLAELGEKMYVEPDKRWPVELRLISQVVISMGVFLWQHALIPAPPTSTPAKTEEPVKRGRMAGPSPELLEQLRGKSVPEDFSVPPINPGTATRPIPPTTATTSTTSASTSYPAPTPPVPPTQPVPPIKPTVAPSVKPTTQVLGGSSGSRIILKKTSKK